MPIKGPGVAWPFKRTAPAVQRRENQSKRCSYWRVGPRRYSSVVLLKETVNFKAQVLFVFIFLNYMPTCMYILGGMIPIYSLKVWSKTMGTNGEASGETRWGQHGRAGPSEPLPEAYRHYPCYLLSFPPEVWPGPHANSEVNGVVPGGRDRPDRPTPLGWAQFEPQESRPHECRRRVDCMDVGGVILLTNSVLWALLYIVGLPFLIRYLIGITRAQLYECEWWTNYETAWRRFNVVCKECEAWSIDQILGNVMQVWREQAVADAVAFRGRAQEASAKATKKWGVRLLTLVFCPLRCLLRVCCGGKDPKRLAALKKYQAMLGEGDDGARHTGPARKARELRATEAWSDEPDDVSVLSGATTDDRPKGNVSIFRRLFGCVKCAMLAVCGLCLACVGRASRKLKRKKPSAVAAVEEDGEAATVVIDHGVEETKEEPSNDDEKGGRTEPLYDEDGNPLLDEHGEPMHCWIEPDPEDTPNLLDMIQDDEWEPPTTGFRGVMYTGDPSGDPFARYVARTPPATSNAPAPTALASPKDGVVRRYRTAVSKWFDNVIMLAVLTSVAALDFTARAPLQDLLGAKPINDDEWVAIVERHNDNLNMSSYGFTQVLAFAGFELPFLGASSNYTRYPSNEEHVDYWDDAFSDHKHYPNSYCGFQGQMNCMLQFTVNWICGIIFFFEVFVKLSAFYPGQYRFPSP